jgi:hypothetical protein
MGLGSGIRKKNLFRIPDLGPGVKMAPDPGSGSATLLTGRNFTNGDFIEANRNFNLNFSSQKEKTTKNCEYHKHIQKVLFRFLGPSKHIHLMALSLSSLGQNNFSHSICMPSYVSLILQFWPLLGLLD